MRAALCCWLFVCSCIAPSRPDFQSDDAASLLYLIDGGEAPKLYAADRETPELSFTLEPNERITAFFYPHPTAALGLVPGRVVLTAIDEGRSIPTPMRALERPAGERSWIALDPIDDRLDRLRILPLDVFPCANAGGCFAGEGRDQLCQLPCDVPDANPTVEPPQPPILIDPDHPLECELPWKPESLLGLTVCAPPPPTAPIQCADDKVAFFDEECAPIDLCPTAADPMLGTLYDMMPAETIADAIARLSMETRPLVILVPAGDFDVGELQLPPGITLHGECTKETIIHPAPRLRLTGDGAALRHLTIAGGSVFVDPDVHATIDHVLIDAGPTYGLSVPGHAAIDHLVIRNRGDACVFVGGELDAHALLIDGCRGYGIWSNNMTTLTALERTIIRNVEPAVPEQLGIGLKIDDTPFRATKLELSSNEHAAWIDHGTGTFTDLVVRGDGLHPYGLVLANGSTASIERADLSGLLDAIIVQQASRMSGRSLAFRDPLPGDALALASHTESTVTATSVRIDGAWSSGARAVDASMRLRDAAISGPESAVRILLGGRVDLARLALSDVRYGLRVEDEGSDVTAADLSLEKVGDGIAASRGHVHAERVRIDTFSEHAISSGVCALVEGSDLTALKGTSAASGVFVALGGGFEWERLAVSGTQAQGIIINQDDQDQPLLCAVEPIKLRHARITDAGTNGLELVNGAIVEASDVLIERAKVSGVCVQVAKLTLARATISESADAGIEANTTFELGAEHVHLRKSVKGLFLLFGEALGRAPITAHTASISDSLIEENRVGLRLCPFHDVPYDLPALIDHTLYRGNTALFEIGDADCG